MGNFAEKAEAFLRHAEKQYPAPFQVERNAVVCGQNFPMVAQYEKRDDRYFMGVISSVSAEGYCGEQCYFLCTEQLSEGKLAEYLEQFRRIQDEQVPADDPYHDFTLISAVICTADVERKVQRKIRRVSDYRQYKEKNGQHGWSALRLCVVDVENGQYYCNSMGKSVKECLTRDGLPQKKKAFWQAK